MGSFGVVLFFGSFLSLVYLYAKMDPVQLRYRCGHCGEGLKPGFPELLTALRAPRKRYLCCPKCRRCGWANAEEVQKHQQS